MAYCPVTSFAETIEGISEYHQRLSLARYAAIARLKCSWCWSQWEQAPKNGICPNCGGPR